MNQSHGGSGKQARAVIDGLEADVVTLALAYDVEPLLERAQLIPRDWQSRLPQQQLPVHLDDRVRGAQGQPEGDQGLGRPGEARRRGHHAEPEDLRRRALELPGGLGLRAAQAGRRRRRRATSSAAIYKNVPVLDSGARGSTTTFVERGIGDVLITWENEALLVLETLGKGKFEIVVPSLSHPGRAAGRGGRRGRTPHGTRAVAEAYLEVPVHARGQDLIAAHHYRPRDPAVAAKYAAKFPKLELFTIDGLRRLEGRAGEALRRRRHLRPDLPGRAR